MIRSHIPSTRRRCSSCISSAVLLARCSMGRRSAILIRIKYVDLQKCYPVKSGEALPVVLHPKCFAGSLSVRDAGLGGASLGEGSTERLGLRSPVRSNSAVLVRSLHVSLTCQRAFRLLEQQSLYAQLFSMARVRASPWQRFALQPSLPYVAYRV